MTHTETQQTEPQVSAVGQEQAEADAEFSIDLAIQAESAKLRGGESFKITEWVIGLLYELDAAEERIKALAKEHLAYLLSDAKTRRAGLLWKFGQQIRAEVDAELAGQKRRSISYATGRAGYRKVGGHKKLVILDEAATIRWAEVNARHVISRTINRPMLEHDMAAMDAPPGCVWETSPEGDAFYIGPVTVHRPQLPVPDPQLPRQSAKDFFGASVADEPF